MSSGYVEMKNNSNLALVDLSTFEFSNEYVITRCCVGHQVHYTTSKQKEMWQKLILNKIWTRMCQVSNMLQVIERNVICDYFFEFYKVQLL